MTTDDTRENDKWEGVEPLDSKALLQSLLDDAKRVAAYGQRTGRLTDNELFMAIAASERNPDNLDWSSPAIISLQSCLSRAVAAISPTTIADLRDKTWKPFQPDSKLSMKHLLSVGFSLVLMFCAAFFTVQYDQGVQLVIGVQKLINDQPRAEIGAILRHLIRAQQVPVAPAEAATKSALADEPYFIQVDRLHEFDARFQFYEPQVKTFLDANPLPHEILQRQIASLSQSAAGLMSVPKAVAAPDTPIVTPELLASSGYDPYDPCVNPASPELSKRFAATDLGKMFSAYWDTSADILCAEGVRFMPYLLVTYSLFVQKAQQWSNALGLWYLPALYGALGATLFYLRRILDPSVPDPNIPRILHRIALGAFAGVIITWFWAPNKEMAEGVESMGLTLFTLAFLIGFCVDVLFALLDRLVNSLMDIAKGVARSQQGTTVPAVVLKTESAAKPDPKPSE